MIARILDKTFKKAELMSYEDFRANGRLLYDIVRLWLWLTLFRF
jgi:hypothetical protein